MHQNLPSGLACSRHNFPSSPTTPTVGCVEVKFYEAEIASAVESVSCHARRVGPRGGWTWLRHVLVYIVRAGIGGGNSPVQFPPSTAIIDSQTIPAPPTPCPDPTAAGTAATRPTASSGTSPWMRRAHCSPSLAPPPPRSPTATPHTDCWPHGAAVSAPSGWSGSMAVTPDSCSSGRKTFSPLLCGSSNASPRRHWFPRPRHDHDHDQATRPNPDGFQHPLS
jgi:hypothetical protein